MPDNGLQSFISDLPSWYPLPQHPTPNTQHPTPTHNIHIMPTTMPDQSGPKHSDRHLCLLRQEEEHRCGQPHSKTSRRREEISRNTCLWVSLNPLDRACAHTRSIWP